MSKLPPLRAIQALEAVGRLGSVNEAANELGVSPGAVSQQLRKAEEALGARLLERKGRNVELTTWGRLYYSGIAVAFEELRNAQNALAKARMKSGLVVSCLPSLAIKWIGPQLLDWQIAHSGASIRLVGTETEPRLQDDQTDFRISYGEKRRDFEHYSEMFTDWVVPACAPTLLARHPLSSPADVFDLPLLGIEWDRVHRSPPGWAEWAARIGATYKGGMGEVVFSLSSAAIDAAVNGHGFVLAQLGMVADELASGRLVVPFDTRIRMPEPYFLAWNRAALEKPHGAEFRAWVLAISKRQHILSAPPPQ
ncbi:LysR family transcriptional regulator [Mesorhizobium sp. IMUNJ 23033]